MEAVAPPATAAGASGTEEAADETEGPDVAAEEAVGSGRVSAAEDAGTRSGATPDAGGRCPAPEDDGRAAEETTGAPEVEGVAAEVRGGVIWAAAISGINSISRPVTSGARLVRHDRVFRLLFTGFAASVREYHK